MSATTTLLLIALVICIDILCFTKFKNYFTYEVEEYCLVDDKGKVIKKLSYEEAIKLGKEL